jgi:anaphase-promoting complex subunit 6
MQEVALGNLAIAREYLTAAFSLCNTDPLLINEIGVVAYLEDDYESAIRHFELALTYASENGSPPSQSASTRLNLAHAFRKALRFAEALEQFEEVVRLGLREASIFSSKGLVFLELDMAFEATVALHEALAISPQDPIASDLLTRALSQLEGEGVLGGAYEQADEDTLNGSLDSRLDRIRQKQAPRGGARRRRARREMRPLDDNMDLDSHRTTARSRLGLSEELT